MRSTFPRRWVAAMALCAAVAVTVSACGGSDSAPATPSTVTVTSSSSSSATTTGSTVASPAAGGGETTDATPSVGDPTAPASVAARATADPIPVALTPADANVPASDFSYDPSGNVPGHYFRSPSGNVGCGHSSLESTVAFGCSARTSVRSRRGPACANTDMSAYSDYLYFAGDLASTCTVRTIYSQIFYPSNGGPPALPRVLEYGQIVSIDGTTCASTTAGITCFRGLWGFTLSRDRNERR